MTQLERTVLLCSTLMFLGVGLRLLIEPKQQSPYLDHCQAIESDAGLECGRKGTSIIYDASQKMGSECYAVVRDFVVEDWICE